MILPVDPQRYLLCLGVTGLFAVTPGPAVLFCVATAVARGRRAALAGLLGVNCASLAWFAAGALGVGALMTAAPLLFRALAWAGVAYLAWLGLRSLQEARGAALESSPVGSVPRRGAAWTQGFLVQIANPKLLVFFTTIVPPFLDVRRNVAPQMAMFAAGLVGMDTLALGAYGLAGAALARRMREPATARRFAMVRGALLLAAAVIVALERGLG